MLMEILILVINHYLFNMKAVDNFLTELYYTNMDLFEVQEIWQIGTRIYFREDFVTIAPFEKEAYDFYTRYVLDPRFGMTFHNFCKRINKIYKQNLKALECLKDDFKKCEEFENVEIVEKPSAIGLPWVLSYTHIKTGVRTEFDGVIFVSKKRITDKTFIINEAKDFVKKQGFIVLDIAQTGSSNSKAWEKLTYNSSGHCNWRYVTKNTNLREKTLILAIDFTDPRIHRITYPTGDVDKGKKFLFLIGDITHIKQVIAHEAETIRYLLFLENRMIEMRNNILAYREKFLSSSILENSRLKRIWNLVNFFHQENHWAETHKSLAKLIEFKSYLDIFHEILKVYRDYEENGIGFKNLPSPIQFKNAESSSKADKKEYSQYVTNLPYPIEIKDKKLIIKNYNKSYCGYYDYPERLLDFREKIKGLADDTFEWLQSTTTTAGMYIAIIGIFIASFALIISIFPLLKQIMVSIINFLTNLKQ